jgi:hypothetical protein
MLQTILGHWMYGGDMMVDTSIHPLVDHHQPDGCFAPVIRLKDIFLTYLIICYISQLTGSSSSSTNPRSLSINTPASSHHPCQAHSTHEFALRPLADPAASCPSWMNMTSFSLKMSYLPIPSPTV